MSCTVTRNACFNKIGIDSFVLKVISSHRLNTTTPTTLLPKQIAILFIMLPIFSPNQIFGISRIFLKFEFLLHENNKYIGV